MAIDKRGSNWQREWMELMHVQGLCPSPPLKLDLGCSRKRLRPSASVVQPTLLGSICVAAVRCLRRRTVNRAGSDWLCPVTSAVHVCAPSWPCALWLPRPRGCSPSYHCLSFTRSSIRRNVKIQRWLLTVTRCLLLKPAKNDSNVMTRRPEKLR